MRKVLRQNQGVERVCNSIMGEEERPIENSKVTLLTWIGLHYKGNLLVHINVTSLSLDTAGCCACEDFWNVSFHLLALFSSPWLQRPASCLLVTRWLLDSQPLHQEALGKRERSSLVVPAAALILGLIDPLGSQGSGNLLIIQAQPGYLPRGKAGELRPGDLNPRYWGWEARVSIKRKRVIISKGNMAARQTVTTGDHHPSPCLGRQITVWASWSICPVWKDKTAIGWNYKWLSCSVLAISLSVSAHHPSLCVDQPFQELLTLRTSEQLYCQVTLVKWGLRHIWGKGLDYIVELWCQRYTVYGAFPIESTPAWLPSCKVTSVPEMRGLESHHLSRFLFQRDRRVQ